MNNIKRVITLLNNNQPSEIDGYNSLVELALNLRWSWNHSTDYI